MTTTISQTLTISQGQSLSFSGEAAFEFVALQPFTDMSLVINGAVSVSFLTRGIYDAGAYALMPGSLQGGKSSIEIGATGRFSLSAPFENSAATFGGANTFVNHGTVSVQGDYSAYGPAVASQHLENTGTISASARVDAFGVIVSGVVFQNTPGPAFTNSGAINASVLEGHATAVAFDVSGGAFQNTGSIVARADGGAAVSVGVLVDASGVSVANGGLISGQYAVTVASFHGGNMHLSNTGELRGQVSLSDYADTFTNSGTVSGDVLLGSGADLYDGRNGVLSGRVLGGGGDDSIATGAQADVLIGDDGADTLNAAAGDDTVNGGLGNDLILDSSGSNYLRGDDGNDSVSGGANFDDINGNAGADTAHGNDGDDWVVGGKDGDLLFGDNGFDIVYGNLGDDTVSGGDGADWVRGGQGADSVSGGAGDDLIWGDRGDDTVSGGSGADTFHSFSGAGLDRILDFSLAEGDRVQLDPGTAYTIKQVGADAVIDLGGSDQVVLIGVQASSLTAASVFVG